MFLVLLVTDGSEGEVRGAPRRAHHRLGPRRRCRALAPLHHRSLPSR
jgi:hypothetical protein